MKLYELKNEFSQVWELIDSAEENGIDDQTILDTLESIQGELSDKAVNVALMVKELKNTIAAYKAEEDRLYAKRKQMEKEVEFFKSYLITGMEVAGLTKISDIKAQISIRNTPESPKFDDESAFIEWAQNNGRDDLLNFSVSIAKTTVKQSLQAGGDLPGVRLVSGKSVTIK